MPELLLRHPQIRVPPETWIGESISKLPIAVAFTRRDSHVSHLRRYISTCIGQGARSHSQNWEVGRLDTDFLRTGQRRPLKARADTHIDIVFRWHPEISFSTWRVLLK